MNLDEIANEISGLKPGEWYSYDLAKLEDVIPPPLPGWTAPERVMENIVGSAWEFQFVQDPLTEVITFMRLRMPLTGNLRTYVSPDRRGFLRQRMDGLWEP